MKPVKSLPLLIIFLLSIQAAAQQDRSSDGQRVFEPVMKSETAPLSGDMPENLPDYKIISSNSSYIEIEFYPDYQKPEKITYEGETFAVLDFQSSYSRGIDESGHPDIRARVFPLILPSEKNNTVTVTDYDVNEVTGVNLVPVPSVLLRDPSRRDFENIELAYRKDAKLYSQRNFLPVNMAYLKNIGAVRELIVGNLVIEPYQYNPSSRVLKQYTRIRVRVTFGSPPVLINRQRSRNELELLQGIALNSDIAIGWMNPSMVNYFRDKVITNSVLSSGDFYKIEVRDNGTGASEGMYKITKSFLESAGINLANVDPRTIRMYGNGGNILPVSLTEPRPEDLQQIAIYIEGENDGVFDQQDYILFYGRSVNNWNFTDSIYSHYLNYHSSSNYYWIRIPTEPSPVFGRRMVLQPSENNQNPLVPSSFTEKIFYEPEINNLINEGNLWLSERKVNGQSFIWSNTLTGLAPNSVIRYTIKPAARVLCPNSLYFRVSEENSVVAPFDFGLSCVEAGFGNWINTSATSFWVNQSQKTNGDQSKFVATFFCSTPDGEGYLDWMEIQYSRRLNSASGDVLRFDSPNVNGPVEYNVSSFSSNQIRIFDITGHDSVRIIQPLQAGSNSVKFQKSQFENQLSRFIVSGPNGYKTPSAISSKVPNQNLKGTYNDGASFVIITHKDFLPAANRLKELRRVPRGNPPDTLKTYIFETEQIYNEFSGGLLDEVAIRDFLKYCWDNWQEKPVYVCLLGDGDFDYKNILVQDGNWVPAYEVTDPQINQVNGYATDDFFADILSTGDGRPDLSIARIPARSLEEANRYLDKVECYESLSNSGYWKNKMVFVGDDGRTTSGNEGSQHTDQAEQLAEQFTPEHIEKVKIYIVTYPTVITSQGRRKPGANIDIVKRWNEGCLNMHYTGHGSPDVWAHEYILEKDVVISQLDNHCKYPFVTIASCDMSKFDNPLVTSAGELFVMAPRKGAIASLAASRPVYGGQNAIFMNNTFSKLYMLRDTLLLPLRFGRGLFLSKQSMNPYTINENKFILMCDPTARVQLPRYRSKIDSISGLAGDTMRALSKIRIYGSVMRADSSFWNDFNGKIFLKIFDVTRNIRMFDEDGFLFQFKLPGGIIFSGTQSVKNGKWFIEFIVPKDISYLDTNGKLINYFYSAQQGDGAGIYKDFIVGGIDPNAPVDTTGPKISLYLNTRNFRSGDVVNENFKLLADMFDESGINTTGTIGHKIEAVLDNNESSKYDLTGFYNSDTSYKSGSLEYDFNSISEGSHSLKLKAWDTYNNSSEVEIDFNVTSSGALQVTNVYNYPNPFRDNTAFTFQHNFPDNINVKIKVYTVAGRLIKEIEKREISEKFVMIDWSGKDEDGETLGNGVYIYKLIVETSDGRSITSTGKLAVLK